MLTDEQGVKAILYLQKLAGINEPKEVALKNWRNMPRQEKEQTEKVYIAFSRLIEEGEQCKQN
jgi:hypothetical protein